MHLSLRGIFLCFNFLFSIFYFLFFISIFLTLYEHQAISIIPDGEIDSPTQSTSSSSSTREEILAGFDDYTQNNEREKAKEKEKEREKEKEKVPYLHTTHTASSPSYSLPSSPTSCNPLDAFLRVERVLDTYVQTSR